MSTKMHNARVPKDRWLEFAADVRRVYLAEHPFVKLFRSERLDYGSYRKAMDSLDRNESFVELQLFDEGDTWLVRPLEQGWFFMNHVYEGVWKKFGVKAVSYDNRSDVPKKDRKNKKVAAWCDARIEAREYLLYPVLDRTTYSELYTDRGGGS